MAEMSSPVSMDATNLADVDALSLMSLMENTVNDRTSSSYSAFAPLMAPDLDCNVHETEALLQLLDDGRPEPAVATAPKPTKKRSRNPSRERLQQELAYLRAKVVELEDKLSVLQKGKAVAATTSVNSSDGCAATDSTCLPTALQCLSATRVWKRIAQRQLHERDRALTENARLKEMLQMQIQLAKGLELMLLKPVQSAAAACAEHAHLIKRPRCANDSDIYNTLVGQLDTLYDELDEVFAANGLAESTSDLHSVRVLGVPNDGDDTTTKDEGDPSGESSVNMDSFMIEMCDVNVVPFDMHITFSALWRSVAVDYAHEYEAHREVDPGTVQAKFSAKLTDATSGSKNAWSHARFAMRQVANEHRRVMVWSCDCDYVNIHDSEDARMLERGWVEVSHVLGEKGETMSVIKSCTRIMPWASDDDTNAESLHPARIGKLTDAVIGAHEDDMAFLQQAVENILIEEATSVTALDHLCPSAGATTKREGAEQ
ncbi:TPA: hypothetical protein N0F65_011182 [Lagenidium giganteum]|uniref:M96 mating-specific protein family n=1 Tax=Lagenidium giganteum TaxID=4803 RepID=A0AAV2Z893_9STRA|nr:TPA: hypothetical protein N0F65_011182 [Lagenidium giganteum]